MKFLITMFIAAVTATVGAQNLIVGNVFAGAFLLGAALGGTWVVGKSAGREEAGGAP